MKAFIQAAGPAYLLLGKPSLLYMTEACAEAGINDITAVTGSGGALAHRLPDTVRCAAQEGAVRELVSPEDEIWLLRAEYPLITPVFLAEAAACRRTQNADALAVCPGLTLVTGEALLYGLDHRTGAEDLWDMAETLRGAGRKVADCGGDPSVRLCVSEPADWAEAARLLRARINGQHMACGVRMIDPATTYIDATVEIAAGVTLYPGTILEGHCIIESDAVIGPNTRMTDTRVGAGSTVQYSVLTRATVGRNTDIGPFAYLRPHAVIGDHCKIGDFVEVKNAHVGSHSKASHLAYIGDADVGEHVNFGCGAITVNYDGKKKHRTRVKDHAFVGSNSNLVAPVTVSEGAFIAAGSTITDEIPAGALAIARARQTNKLNWKKKP